MVLTYYHSLFISFLYTPNVVNKVAKKRLVS
nr:MAG TPA: hypothetical protein [Caudoviricetes sp.]